VKIFLTISSSSCTSIRICYTIQYNDIRYTCYYIMPVHERMWCCNSYGRWLGTVPHIRRWQWFFEQWLRQSRSEKSVKTTSMFVLASTDIWI
jgi:hypothetical protein